MVCFVLPSLLVQKQFLRTLHLSEQERLVNLSPGLTYSLMGIVGLGLRPDGGMRKISERIPSAWVGKRLRSFGSDLVQVSAQKF